jgi:hypothetical protein
MLALVGWNIPLHRATGLGSAGNRELGVELRRGIQKRRPESTTLAKATSNRHARRGVSLRAIIGVRAALPRRQNPATGGLCSTSRSPEASPPTIGIRDRAASAWSTLGAVRWTTARIRAPTGTSVGAMP